MTRQEDSSQSSLPRAPEAPMSALLTEKETAALLRISVKALQRWRCRGTGPKFLKFGSCVRYRRGDLQDFVLQSLRSSTSDPGPGESPRGLPAPPRRHLRP